MPNTTFTPEQIAQILEEFFRTVGTRQYIGPRIVPLFGRKDEESIEWDNTAPYESLTVVLYQGNSYTSRQFVPVGVEITNQAFWAETGNYNAQVEQYRQTVLAFDGRITQNAADIVSETQARIAADNEETQARIAADNELADQITAEAEARRISDNSLGDAITQLRQSLENTDDAIDDVKASMPYSSFSSTNTIKNYIDAADEYLETTTDAKIATAIAGIANAAPVFVGSTSAMTDTTKIYVLTTNSHVYAYNGTNFVDTGVIYSSDVTAEKMAVYVSGSNWSTALPDLNLATAGTTYIMLVASGTTALPANFPIGEMYGSLAIIRNICNPSLSPNGVQTVTFAGMGATYTRGLNYTTHAQTSQWYTNAESLTNKLLANANDNTVPTVLPDINNLSRMGLYDLVVDPNTHQNKPAHMPFDAAFGTMTTFASLGTWKGTPGLQIAVANPGYIFTRIINNVSHAEINPWHSVRPMDTIYVSKSKTTRLFRDLLVFNKLLDAFQFAYTNWKDIRNIIILDGEYDVYQEYVDHYGNATVEGFDGSDKWQYGLLLWDVNVISNPNVQIKFEYTGDNAFIKREFSLFHASREDDIAKYTLQGINAYCRNIRYVVHDELSPAGESIGQQIRNYINCDLKIDNTGNATWGIHQVIGGGLGKSTIINVDSCIFSSVGMGDNNSCVSWHNNSRANAQSIISIRNCYFVEGTARFGYYGASTRLTKCIVTNCSMRGNPAIYKETPTSENINMVLYAWNNNIRA